MSPVQVKEKIIDQVYRNLPYSQRPKVESVALGNAKALLPSSGRCWNCRQPCVIPCVSTEWRPGSTGQILSDLDLTSQKEGRWKKFNTLAHYNVSANTEMKRLHLQTV